MLLGALLLLGFGGHHPALVPARAEGRRPARLAHRPAEPPQPDERPRACACAKPRPSGRCCWRSSTSTASRRTTTRSAIPPATRCSRASARNSGGHGQRRRHGVPHGRRRVLRARRRSAAGRGPTCSRRRPRALSRERRGLHRSRASYGVGAAADRDARRLGGAAPGRPADVCAQGRRAAPRPAGRAPTCCCSVLAERDPTSAPPERGHRALRQQSADRLGAAGGGVDALCCRPRPCTTSARSAIPDAILDKPGPLTRRRVDVHPPPHDHRRADPRRGAALCRARRSSCAGATSASTARATPTASRGDDIPLGARIIGVCDAYDAMISDRALPRGHDAPTTRSPSFGAAPARSSTRWSWKRSARRWPSRQPAPELVGALPV